MAWNNKVVWSEGMFLQPQHFQQQDRHLEHLLDGRTRPLLRNAWGFTQLEIDTAALALGKLQLRLAAGLMPDGTPFDIPGTDAPPPAVDIDALMKDECVVLALPLRQAGTVDVEAGSAERGLARYSARETEVIDTAGAGSQAALIQVGSLRLRLMRERDAVDGYCRLAVAQVLERRADNTVVLARDFVAPTLHVGASAVLGAIVADIHGRLQQLGEALAASLGQPGRGGIGEVAEFLMLQTINRHQPLFAHLGATPQVHPEELFTRLLQLTGDLAVFNPGGRRPRFAVQYRQDDLRASFAPVVAELRTLLSARPEAAAVQIDLIEKRFGVRVAVISDLELLQAGTLVLAANAQIPPEALRARFPTQVKAGPSDKIRDLVNLQLPGIALQPLQVAPRQIPFHAGFTYFELERGSDLYRALQKSGSLALHVAGEFPGLEMALWAIRG